MLYNLYNQGHLTTFGLYKAQPFPSSFLHRSTFAVCGSVIFVLIYFSLSVLVLVLPVIFKF